MNIPIYPGSSSFQPGETPFGFYDNDPQFQADADKFAIFAARRLGYPIVEVELQDINFYAALEDAITTYGNELYAYQAQDNFLSFQGAPLTIDSPDTNLVQPNLATVVRIADQYGVEAGVGGTVTWYSGSIDLTAGVQDYDLTQWALDLGITAGDLEIKRIFYEAPPAIVRYFDPYAGTGTGMMQLLDSFGFGGWLPECGPDSLASAKDHGSYRTGLGDHSLTELVREGTWGQHIDGDAQQVAQFVANGS